MVKTNKKNRAFLNSDTGTIFFLLGISLLIVIIGNLDKKDMLNNLLIKALFLFIAIFMLIIGFIIIQKNKEEYIYQVGPKPAEELRSSLEAGMQSAWKDHHHARDQTWKGLQIEALLAIALIGANLKSNGNYFKYVPLVGSGLLFLIAISGIMITLHHRRLEIRKIRHIMHCEDALGLRPYIDGVNLPTPIYIWEVFWFWKSNTLLFIMRMHFTIMIFALFFFMTRL